VSNPVLKHEPIRLIAVGDICPGDHSCMGFGTGALMRSRGTSFALQHVTEHLRKGDVVFGNCEGVLSEIGADPKDIDTMEFRGSPAFAKALRAAGFTVITVANNHVGEHGSEVMRDTIANLRSAALEVIGLRGTNQTAKPLIQEVKGLRIGWLAYTWIVSHRTAQDCQVLSWTKGNEVSKEIAALRPKVDFLVVTPHWGREYVRVPPQSVMDQAHAMADAGADLVLGCHPHVLQGTERRGKCFIIYSLGDFIFDDWQSWLRETALFRCTIKSGAVCDPEFIPLTINRNFQPMPATKAQASRILNSIERSTRAISDPKSTALRSDAYAKAFEAKTKRRLFRSQLLFLAANVGRMGPRIAYQKIRRHVPNLPRWS
jgi:gamma-polyglutamate biosynthesis protein CapA